MASACSTSSKARLKLPQLETVARVDLPRYLWTWSEITSFLLRFQRGCTAKTATYTLLADGDIDVLNLCRIDSIDGEEKSARGRVRAANRATNAMLEVSFFRPFWGDDWIIDLSEDYSYAAYSDDSG